MNWEIIRYNTYPGKYNMDLDLTLVKNCDPQTAYLRFYGWNPYCISIGANQSYSEINKELSISENIDIVKRPTGGRAILHSEELTYSVIIPNNKNVSGRLIYEQISLAIVQGLRSYSNNLLEVELENLSPNFPELLKQSAGSLCFASTAKSEIKFHGKKLVGSAQRKIGDKILQHGSILIGKHHKKLVDFLNIDEDEKNILRNEMTERTTEISSIINEEVNILLLKDNIIEGFEKVFEMNYAQKELTTY
ncbi:MAG: hypothetical protein KDC88_00035 [Ignavibacteriae bacterium]|nr:hypothetical protein [Ignavibacteriota bacterium]